MSWQAFSPSNLALIKYMGKKESQASDSFDFKINDINIGLNPSLSYTLNHFVSLVEIQESHTDCWQAFQEPVFFYKDHYVCSSIFVPSIFSQNNSLNKDTNSSLNNSLNKDTNSSQKDSFKMYHSNKEIALNHDISLENQKKFLEFFQYLKKIFDISGNYQLSSVSNFPLSAGVASSASSFSALVLATYYLAKERASKVQWIDSLTWSDLSELSRLGSGSACRSLFSPWAFWTDRQAKAYQNPFDFFIHQLLVVSEEPKQISSREAHKKILTSPSFEGRPQRAQLRFKNLGQALQSQNWEQCFLICWEEFQDMHNLFETSQPSFSYKTDLSCRMLEQLQNFWKEHKDGPLVTMDAGSNIHLLYRKDQKNLARQIESLFSDFKILSSDIER